MSDTAGDAAAAPTRFGGLKAVFINAMLERSPEPGHTDGLVRLSTRNTGTREHGVDVEVLRAADDDIALGLWPDMTEHGAETDDWLCCW